MTTEFVRTTRSDDPPFSLIEQPGLFSRLIREIRTASADLARDPRGFLLDLLSPDTKDAKRRQRIYLGLACALVVHVSMMVLIVVIGWRTVFVKHVEASRGPEFIVTPVGPPPDNATKHVNAPRGDKDAGSGGGGNENPRPATKGPLPQMSTGPQILKAIAPHVMLPTIKVSPTIVGPDGSPPPPGIDLGIPTGTIASAPSPGPGVGGGLGDKRGSGAGTGIGSSTGPGDNGTGPGGKNRIGVPTGGDTVPTGPIPYNQIARFPDRTPIVWLHRPTPIITPEAQANKVKGEVWLRATFGEDGRISDIEVIREVAYMTESAIQSLQRSTFRPATIKGRPITLLNVPVRINVDVFQR